MEVENLLNPKNKIKVNYLKIIALIIKRKNLKI